MTSIGRLAKMTDDRRKTAIAGLSKTVKLRLIELASYGIERSMRQVERSMRQVETYRLIIEQLSKDK